MQQQHGVCYDEVKLFLDNVIASPYYIDQLENLGEDAFMQFIFDNVDWNRRNDTGKYSWHVMGGIVTVSPGNIIEERENLKRCKIIDPCLKNKFIPIIEPPKAIKTSPVSKIQLRPLPKTCMSGNFVSHGIEVMQETAEADNLIARQCLEDSIKHKVWCMAVDTGILVMLVEKGQGSCKGVYFDKTPFLCFYVLELSNALPSDLSGLIKYFFAW